MLHSHEAMPCCILSTTELSRLTLRMLSIDICTVAYHSACRRGQWMRSALSHLNWGPWLQLCWHQKEAAGSVMKLTCTAAAATTQTGGCISWSCYNPVCCKQSAASSDITWFWFRQKRLNPHQALSVLECAPAAQYTCAQHLRTCACADLVHL
jgi:hypothetical protein